jgi:hypothetical protein
MMTVAKGLTRRIIAPVGRRRGSPRVRTLSFAARLDTLEVVHVPPNRGKLRFLIASGAAALCLAANGSRCAGPTLRRAEAQPESYEGVVPGSGHPPPRAAAVQRRERSDGAAILSWLGFQPLAGGRSRFFLQLSRDAPYQGRSSPGRYELLLRNTRAHLRNTLRPLETRFFDTPVVRADAARRGRDMVVVFELRADVAPSLSVGEGQNGYRFVYVDWPAGDYAPPPSAAEPPPSTGEDGTSIRVYQGRD